MIAALALNFAATIAAMLLLWLVALRLRDVSFVDAVWAYAMVALAWLSAWQVWPASAGEGGPPPRAWLLLPLVSIWGARLGTHLLLRWRRLGADPRYHRILAGAMTRRGWSFARASLLIVFLLQGPLLWFVSLPVQVGIMTPSPYDDPGITPLSWLGAGLALIGIIIESLADWQLARFRRRPDSREQVMSHGLWRYSRHPNYFGDALCWWGLWLLAASGRGPALFTIICPALLTWMLVQWSGKPILEKGLLASRPGYADYVARTSAFIPWPPRTG